MSSARVFKDVAISENLRKSGDTILIIEVIVIDCALNFVERLSRSLLCRQLLFLQIRRGW